MGLDGDFTWGDFQRAETGEPEPLVFTADWMEENFPHGMDEDDIAAMNEAMDRDMRDRGVCPHCGETVR
jgi:hypothetical protein